MENEIIMNLSIVLDIVLGKRSFKITLRFLTFHQFGVRSWDPLPPNQQVWTVFIETTAKAKYRL